MSTVVARFAVVGGGITGLAAAHRLSELAAAGGDPVSVVVVEAMGRVGGQVLTEKRGDAVLEGGADSFLVAKPGALELCERLGLGAELVRIEPGAGGILILRAGRLRELPAGFLMMAPTRIVPLLASPLFSLGAKLRMLLEPFVPPARGDDDESLASFVTRRFGREALERAAEPVLASVFMADAERLSMRAVLPRFVDMERRFGSVTRGLREALGAAAGRPHGGGGFAYLAPGTERIVERIVERLPPGSIRTGAALGALERAGDGRWRLLLEGGAAIVADEVVLACPATATAAALGALDPELADRVRAQAYASCAIVSLAYDDASVRLPRGFGFFAPRGEPSEILAASFASTKFPGRWPTGETLIRVFVGGALRPDLAARSEDDLVQLAHRELARLLAIRGEPRFARALRFSQAMPQYEVGFPARAAAIARRASAHPGLSLAGSVLGAVGLPDCIRSGEQAAESAFRRSAAAPASARAVGHA